MNDQNRRENQATEQNIAPDALRVSEEFVIPDEIEAKAAPKKPKKQRRARTESKSFSEEGDIAPDTADAAPVSAEVGMGSEPLEKPKQKRSKQLIDEPSFDEVVPKTEDETPKKPRRKKKREKPADAVADSEAIPSDGDIAVGAAENTDGGANEADKRSEDFSATVAENEDIKDAIAILGECDNSLSADTDAEFHIPEGIQQEFSLDAPNEECEPELPRHNPDATLDEIWALSLEDICEDAEASETCDSDSEECETIANDATPVEDGAPVITPHTPYKEERYDPKKPRKIDGIFDFVELFIFTLVSVLLVTTFFIRHSVVDGPSMMGTLMDGDVLLISNAFYEPKRGDIVIVEDYTAHFDKKEPIVKRIIAVGGDVVRVTPYAIYVNGEELDEPYVYTDALYYEYAINIDTSIFENCTVEPGEYYEVVVSEGKLFIMGDHRNNSADSRMIGTVREDAVLGKVLLRVFPFESFGTVSAK